MLGRQAREEERRKETYICGVVHSFDGTADDLKRLLAIDNIYIGINGCSLKTEENLEVVR